MSANALSLFVLPGKNATKEWAEFSMISRLERNSFVNGEGRRVLVKVHIEPSGRKEREKGTKERRIEEGERGRKKCRGFLGKGRSIMPCTVYMTEMVSASGVASSTVKRTVRFSDQLLFLGW